VRRPTTNAVTAPTDTCTTSTAAGRARHATASVTRSATAAAVACLAIPAITVAAPASALAAVHRQNSSTFACTGSFSRSAPGTPIRGMGCSIPHTDPSRRPVTLRLTRTAMPAPPHSRRSIFCFRTHAMSISDQYARPATAQRPAAVADVWKKSSLLWTAVLIALLINRPCRANDEPGSFRVSDQTIVPVSNSQNAEGPVDPTGYPVPLAPGSAAVASPAQGPTAAAPTQGTAAPAGASTQVYQNGQPAGPVLELTGNPITDRWREYKFDRDLEDQCAEDYCPVCHKHHPPGHCKADHAHGNGPHGAGCPNGECDECGHCWLRHLCCCRCDGPFGERCLDCHYYWRVYPVNPWYFDARDGRQYSAYGWGAPMTIPLAPTVTQQWNYGWGIPSSRITLISRVAPDPNVIRGAVAPP
jgi:hypothetical protein